MNYTCTNITYFNLTRLSMVVDDKHLISNRVKRSTMNNLHVMKGKSKVSWYKEVSLSKIEHLDVRLVK